MSGLKLVAPAALVLALSAAAHAQCPDLYNYGIQCNHQWVTVPNATSLGGGALSAMTAECWVRQDSSLQLTGGLISKWNDTQGANQRGWVLWMVAGKPTFHISHNGVDFTSVQSPTVMDIGVWHHVAGTYDGSMLRMYVDGVQVAQQPSTGSIHATPTEPLYMGLAKAGGGATAVWLTGSIDEARVWNIARTPDQIWKAHNLRLSWGAGLVGAWNFDDIVAGQTVADSTAGNNTGYLGLNTTADVYDPTRIATGMPATNVAVNFPNLAAEQAAAGGCLPPGTINLSMTVGFAGATSINWYKDNVLLVGGPTGTGSTIAGANGYDLTISNTSSADSGSYFCRVGGCGVWASNERSVTVCGAPATGACCNGASCSATTSAACSGAGKHFSGTGVACNAAGNNTTPCCRADFNGSGAVSSQDIFDYLNAWFSASPTADFNGTGGITAQDIFDYLAAWFAGC